MPVFVSIKLTCDHNYKSWGTPECKASADVTAPLTGKTTSKARIDLTEATKPEGWVFRLEDDSAGYGSPFTPEIRCYCPDHSKAK